MKTGDAVVLILESEISTRVENTSISPFFGLVVMLESKKIKKQKTHKTGKMVYKFKEQKQKEKNTQNKVELDF